MTNILLIGNGAREHAMAEAVMRSKRDQKLFSFMKANNPGIADLSEKVALGSYSDVDAIKAFAKENEIDFAIIGPEDPLNIGAVDSMEEIGIKSFGPSKNLARLETSKSWTRMLVQKYNVGGNPLFRVFTSVEGLKEFLEQMDEVVIKPDGLTGGKGVKVQGDHFDTKEEAYDYCKEVLETHASVIVEEKLVGEEFSLQCVSDGVNVVMTPPVQDHKRRFNGDKGPNTGGMGSYTDADGSLPFMTKQDALDGLEITRKVAKAILEETGEKYVGVMYGGFIITKKGVRLIEYNARWGDPEAMNTHSVMKTDYIDLIEAAVDGKLDQIDVEFEPMATVCKYAVPTEYPDAKNVEGVVSVADVPEDIKIYYASVDKREDGLHITSSRTIGVVGIARTIKEAEAKCEAIFDKIKGPVDHRTDIGTEDLIQKRIDHMKEIRD
ncbi:phosphoribosylamine--glycine ligase [Candidatus Woesearchaeota archaeon]|nr:phosphoribosylamine--glycine ligase [Candidatus Woesearchaeota archaeon]